MARWWKWDEEQEVLKDGRSKVSKERGEAEGKGERKEGVHRIEEREGKRGRKIEGRKVGIGSSSLLLSS